MSKRVAELEERYLPHELPDLGDYSQEQQDDARACILLVHAELEHYLEELSADLAETALQRVLNGEYDPLIVALFFHADAKSSEISGNCVEDIVKAVVGMHKRRIKGNNGLKAADVNKLFSPFHIGDVNLDTQLSAALDAFGSKRGENAHLGALGIRREINAEEVKKDIDELMGMLRIFDAEICDEFELR